MGWFDEGPQPLPSDDSKLAGTQIKSVLRNRKRVRTAMLATAGVMGLSWVLYMVEPFSSKMEPYKYRGQGVPTVPKTGFEAETVSVHPSSATQTPHTGIVRGEVEGRAKKVTNN